MKKITLRKRLIAINILTVIIMFVLFSGVIYHINQNVSKDINEKQIFMMKNVEDQIISQVMKPIYFIENVDKIILDDISIDSKTVTSYLETIISTYDYFANIYIIDSNGVIINSAPFNMSLLRKQSSYKYYYVDKELDSSIKWSEVYVSVFSGNPTIQLSKEFDGYTIVSELDLNKLPVEISENDFFEMIKSMSIVDRYGTYIMNEKQELVESRNKFEQFDQIEAAYKNGDHFIGTKDKVFFGKNEQLGWYFILEFYSEHMFSDLQFINVVLISLWIIFTLVLTMVLSIYLTKFNREIKKLKATTKKISEGKYEVNQDKYVFKELCDLKDDFDRMMNIIVSRENDIIMINNDLEEKIIEKTASLKQANDYLNEQIKERRKAEAAVLQINRTLDKQVQRRTKTLELINNKLRDSIKTQKVMEKTKNTFFAMMNHEMRTPLNGIIGFIQLLELEGLNEEQSEMLENIKNSAKFLQKIISNILDYSKYETESISLELDSFDLKQVLTSSIQSFKLLAQEKGIDFKMKFATDFRNRVIGDETKLVQVINNLLSNSLKFTSKGFIEVDASTTIEDTQVHLIIKVKDSGIGISEEDKKNIFKPFSQGNENSGKTFEGSGLGLAISQKIAQKMNGNISFESTSKIGTTFTFEAYLDPEENDSQNQEIKVLKLLPDYKTLVADEKLVNNEALFIYLMEHRISYDIALNQKDAMDLCRKEKYDVIFIDYQNNWNDDSCFSDKIREIAGNGSKIVAISSGQFEKKEHTAEKTSIDAVLSRKLDDNLLNDVFSLVKELDMNNLNDKNDEKSTIRGIYAEILKQEVGFDDETCLELINTFVIQAKETFLALDEHFLEREDKKTLLLLHKLKGAAGVIRAEEIRKMIELSETLMKKGKRNEARKIINNVKAKKLFDSMEA